MADFLNFGWFLRGTELVPIAQWVAGLVESHTQLYSNEAVFER
jgi:hypothetical protein